MTRKIRLTRFAEASLFEIAAWTVENFGPRQAERYRETLLGRISELASGTLSGRSCRHLVPDLQTDLMFLRAGNHLVIYRSDQTVIDILDFLHAHSNLAVHVTRLADDP